MSSDYSSFRMHGKAATHKSRCSRRPVPGRKGERARLRTFQNPNFSKTSCRVGMEASAPRRVTVMAAAALA